MATRDTVDRQAQLVRLILVILGAILAVVGGYRWAAAATPSSGQYNAPPPAAVPVDAITTIVDAFRSYPVVGLSAGEGHGGLRGPAVVVSPCSANSRSRTTRWMIRSRRP